MLCVLLGCKQSTDKIKRRDDRMVVECHDGVECFCIPVVPI
jgi:hypothetical protein